MDKNKKIARHNKLSVSSYGAHAIDVSDIKAVSDIMRFGWLTQGPEIQKFESALAKYCGTKYAVAVSSGTAALHVAYIAAGIKKGDEVITTPNTFVATANMLIAVGAKPVFCDVRFDTKNIDEKKIEALITKKTKAIVPVHFAGHPVAMSTLTRIAKKHKLVVIEDACHALGATYKGTRVGSLSDMTVFSFHPVKNVTTGEGGAIVTDNKKYYETLKKLRSHGIEKDTDGYNSMVEMGYNYRMTDMQASLGTSQLKKLDTFLKKRKMLAQYYLKFLKNVDDITIPVEEIGIESAWHLFVINLKEKKLRKEFIAYLKEKGIGTNIHYPAVYSHPFYRNNGFKKTKLHTADFHADSCVTIPLHVKLNKADVAYICDTIQLFFKKYAKK